MKYLLAGLYLFTFVSIVAQTKTDSLVQAMNEAKADIERIDLLNALSAEVRSADFKRSLEYAKEAIERSERIVDSTRWAKSLLNAGMAEYFLGNSERAIEYYLSSLRISESKQDKRGIVMVLNELGTLEKKNGDLKGSEEHLGRALSLSHQLLDSALIANSMNNMGHVFELKNDLQRAMQFYSESAEMKEKLKDFYGAAFNYDNMGNILSKMGRYDEAKKYFDREIVIFKQLNDRMAYAIALNNMGEMHNLKGDYRLARTYLLQSLKESKSLQYRDLTRHIYGVIADTYRAEKNFERAFEYFSLSTALKDSLFNEQKSKQLLEAQAKFETQQKENQIEILSQQNKLKDLGLKQNRLFIIGLIIVVLGLLLIGFLWQNRTRLQQKVALEATRAGLREAQLQAVIASQEEERKRFAADLHDGLGQIISAVRLSLSKDNPDKQTVNYALGLLNDMNIEIRNIAFNLMPHSLMKDGLQEALEELAARINRAGRLEVVVNAFNVPGNLSPELTVALYRICQEWINNVIKYSNATNITVQLVQHVEELVVTIEDDGDGFDTTLLTLGGGNGWKNINSRIGLIKGSVEIDSQPGRSGSILMATVPQVALELQQA